ncbi:MAG: ROK family transcriptional regulator [Micrococcaceae bacterium]|nr:ROK family transcriptional regulator [Micrococcaceae bacterium]
MNAQGELSTTDKLVVQTLLQDGPTTRSGLQQQSGFSRPTISAAVSRLIDRGLLEESGLAAYGAGRNGRPQVLLRPRSTIGAALGIELGRARVAVTVAALDGTVLAQKLSTFEAGPSLSHRLSVALRSVRTLMTSGTITADSIVGTGVAISGRHLPTGNDPEAAEDDPAGLPLERLRQLIPAPVLWDNNTRLAALRHLREAPASATTGLFYVVLSDGISAGLIDGTEIFRGGHGVAGELGHLCVDPAGPDCWCGSRGCLEALIGTGALLRRAAAQGLEVDTPGALASLAEDGNQRAGELVSWAGTLLGVALASASMLIDPRRIILSGQLTQGGTLLHHAALEELTRRREAVSLPVPELILHPGTQYEASHGAALQALQRWGTDFLAAIQ